MQDDNNIAFVALGITNYTDRWESRNGLCNEIVSVANLRDRMHVPRCQNDNEYGTIFRFSVTTNRMDVYS